jgi:hypothetical protein
MSLITDHFDGKRNDDPVEDKSIKRAELSEAVEAFLANGGKVKEIPYGAGVTDEHGDVRRDKDGTPLSGVEGIVWDSRRNQWKVLSRDKRTHPLGFVDSVNQGILLLKQYGKKIKQIKSRGK